MVNRDACFSADIPVENMAFQAVFLTKDIAVYLSITANFCPKTMGIFIPVFLHCKQLQLTKYRQMNG